MFLAAGGVSSSYQSLEVRFFANSHRVVPKNVCVRLSHISQPDKRTMRSHEFFESSNPDLVLPVDPMDFPVKVVIYYTDGVTRTIDTSV